MNHPYVIAVIGTAHKNRSLSEADRERQGEQTNVGKPNRSGLRALFWRWLRTAARNPAPAQPASATEWVKEQVRGQ